MHINEDRLLEFALETVSDSDRGEIARHLEACPECRSQLQRVENDLAVIGSVRPHLSIMNRPRASRWQRAFYPLLRAAALVVLGLAMGLGGSAWLADEPARVVPQYVTLRAPADSVARFSAADGTDVTADIERQMQRDPQ